MNAEIKPLELNDTWVLTDMPQIRMLLAASGCIRSSTNQMGQWRDIRPG